MAGDGENQSKAVGDVDLWWPVARRALDGHSELGAGQAFVMRQRFLKREMEWNRPA